MPDSPPMAPAGATPEIVMDADALNAFMTQAFGQPLSWTIERVDLDGIRVRQPTGDGDLRPGGTVSGPTLMSMADGVAYMVVLSRIGPAALAVTSNLTINFLRRPRLVDLVTDARLLKLGRSLAVTDVLMYSDDGERGCADATGRAGDRHLLARAVGSTRSRRRDTHEPDRTDPGRHHMSILDSFRVDGKVALVTGAGRGIGRASAIALAEGGADVVIAARTAEQLDEVAEQIRSTGRRAVPVAFDVMELDRLGDLVDVAVNELGGLDLLVNNAGGSMPKALLDTSVRSFERALTFNVTTAFELTKQAVPAMLERGGGSVVNISSVAGRMPDRGFAAYGTAKAALTHLTKEMACDLSPRIRVNGIAVGSVATSALEIVLTNDELRTAMEQSTPLKRLGEPEDIAAGVLYLCSPAGSYMTGKLLEIDGGLVSQTLGMGLPDL